MKKLIAATLGLLAFTSSYADLCQVNVTINKCYQGTYNVTTNLLDNDDTALPVMHGSNNSNNLSLIQYDVNCDGQYQVRLQASVTHSGNILGNHLVSEPSRTQYLTGYYRVGNLISANFPEDFDGASCPPIF